MTLPDLKPTQVLVKTHQASVCGSERYFYRGISVRPEDEARGGPETVLGERPQRRTLATPTPWVHSATRAAARSSRWAAASTSTWAVARYAWMTAWAASSTPPTRTTGSPTSPTCSPSPTACSFEVGCLYEPLGCAAWAAIHTGVKLGDIVAVNGVGFAGNILLQGALKAGASKVYRRRRRPRQAGDRPPAGRGSTSSTPTRSIRWQAVLELTHGEGVDVAVEAIGGTGIGIVQGLGMLRHNGILALYGDNYAPVKEFCFHRFHEDGIEVRNLNAVHYTRLRSVEHMREAYRAVQRGVFNLDIIFENSVQYRLDELPEVFRSETTRHRTSRPRSRR